MCMRRPPKTGVVCLLSLTRVSYVRPPAPPHPALPSYQTLFFVLSLVSSLLALSCCHWFARSFRPSSWCYWSARFARFVPLIWSARLIALSCSHWFLNAFRPIPALICLLASLVRALIGPLGSPCRALIGPLALPFRALIGF